MRSVHDFLNGHSKISSATIHKEWKTCCSFDIVIILILFLKEEKKHFSNDSLMIKPTKQKLS